MLLEWAFTASKRGTCGRLAVGAVIARDSRPIAAGYVGVDPGEPHCVEFRCDLSQPCTRTKHAEINALEFAKKYAIDVRGADMFVTDSPCPECAVAIDEAGIARVFFNRQYRVSQGINYLLNHFVEVHQVLLNGMQHRITRALP